MPAESASRGAAITAAIAFWSALFTFAALHPGYSHLHQAISELGAFGAPNALAWNLIGFAIPGLLLATSGAGIARSIDGRRSALFWLLAASGTGFAGTGVFPAEMHNGSPLMESPWTAAHVVMSSVSGLPWLAATFLLASRVKRQPLWKHLWRVSLSLAVLGLVSFILNLSAGSIPVLDNVPGLVQRIAFAIYFGWFVVIASLLVNVASLAGRANE